MDIGASPDEFRRFVTSLTESESQLRTELGKLTAEADDVFGNGWLGNTSDSFRSIWRQWLTGANDSLDALRRMEELLREGNNTFQTIDHGGAVSLTRPFAGER